MKRTILVALMALPVLLGASTVQAQRLGPADAMDASKMPESGPAVVGGTGATMGPNSKNQAITPMPGLREQELSERPPDAAILPAPEVQLLPGKPVKKTPAPPGR
jgi:hypothetical protein